MNPNRLLLFLSFLVMCQLNKAASIAKPPPPRPINCSTFVSTPLDFVNVENFRSNVKQELKRLNCTQPGLVNVSEADLEKPKKDSISSEHFCLSMPDFVWKTWNLSSYPNLDHIEKIFTNRTLCIVVCTTDLNETLWPYCEAIRNLLGEPAAKLPLKEVAKASELVPENNEVKQPTKLDTSQKKNVADPPDAGKSQKNDPVDPSAPEIPKNEPVPPNPLESQNKEVVDQPDLANSKKGNEKEVDNDNMKEELNPDELEGQAEEVPNAPAKTENIPDSGKKSVKPVESSIQSGKLPSENVPSKSLPQTAIVTGAANLRPENDESHYFIYFVVMSILCIFCYIGIYNKKKILALVIEGRKQKDRRRHASAGYRKLNTNLEEVMPLGTSAPATDSMIY